MKKKKTHNTPRLLLFPISPLIKNRRQRISFNSRIIFFLLTDDLAFRMEFLIKAQQKHSGKEVVKR